MSRDMEKLRLYQKEYRKRHQEARNARARLYHTEHQEARNAKRRAYREAHREEDLLRKQRYAIEKREVFLHYQRAYNEAHHEERLVASRAYQASHREERAAVGKLYRSKNAQKISLYHRQYRKTHPDKVQQHGNRRRARKQSAAINDLTTAQWQEIKSAYGSRCVYCGKKQQRLTMDHITPLIKGGNHTASNIVPACRSCNSRKGQGDPLKAIQPLLLTVAYAKRA